MSRFIYAYVIGSIIHVMICTRPDVLCTLSMMSRYQANPSECHWITKKNILKYLKRTKDIFLIYGGKKVLIIKVYVDASFQNDRDKILILVGICVLDEWRNDDLKKF